MVHANDKGGFTNMDPEMASNDGQDSSGNRDGSQGADTRKADQKGSTASSGKIGNVQGTDLPKAGQKSGQR